MLHIACSLWVRFHMPFCPILPVTDLPPSTPDQTRRCSQGCQVEALSGGRAVVGRRNWAPLLCVTSVNEVVIRKTSLSAVICSTSERPSRVPWALWCQRACEKATPGGIESGGEGLQNSAGRWGGEGFG